MGLENGVDDQGDGVDKRQQGEANQEERDHVDQAALLGHALLRILGRDVAELGEVLVAVAQGRPNNENPATWYVSEATVKSHVGRILATLGLRDRVQVVVLAYETGLVRPRIRPAPS